MKLGKISESILKRTVLKQIKSKRKEIVNGAGIGEDCAIFALEEDSFFASCVQHSVIHSMKDVKYSIHKCVNNIATSGAEPIAIMLTIILPEFQKESFLKNVMEVAEETSKCLNIQIVGGHTTVSNACSQAMVVCTGYGRAKKEEVRTTRGIQPGQDIVVSKWIGLEGTCKIANSNSEELLTRYPAHLVQEAIEFEKYISIVPEAATATKSDVCVMHDVSEGGILGALWEMAESSGVGLTVDLKKIPIKQETIEICEFFNLNPYELLSGGCLLMTTNDGIGLVRQLEINKIPAVMIGKITDEKKRILINEEEIRFLDKPKQDEIYRGFANVNLDRQLRSLNESI